MSLASFEQEKARIKTQLEDQSRRFQALSSDGSEFEKDKQVTEIVRWMRALYRVEQQIEQEKLKQLPDRTSSLTGIDPAQLLSDITPPQPIQWTPQLKTEFCEALLDRYQSPLQLEMFFARSIDEALERLSRNGNLEERCFEAIKELEARGDKLDDLYFAFRETNPNKAFVIPRSQMPDITLDLEPDNGSVALPDSSSSDIPRDRSSLDQTPAHLIFFVQTSQNDPENSVLVRAELHFYDVQAQRIQPEAIDLSSDGSTPESANSERVYAIANLADCLEQACHRGAMRLRMLKRKQQFGGSLKPIVELFLPLGLLSHSLKTWCHDCSKLPANFPIVVRSSERVQDESLDAIIAYDNLEEAWQTFFAVEQQQNPNTPIFPALHELTWHRSSEGGLPDFRNCVGVQCFGHWLTPKSAQWEKLIEAGTPFALWLCDCDILPAERREIFDRLTAGDRFQLLRRICDERGASLSVNVPPGGHHLGVFYEDINYLPTFAPFYGGWAS